MTRITLLILLLLPIQRLAAQITVPLYADSIPLSKKTKNTERVQPHPIVDSLTYNVTNPTLTFFPAAKKTSSASLIIIPGGGYQVLLTKREGSDIARQFNQAGYSCFILKYRLPSDNTSYNKSATPLQDVHQALKLIHHNASTWNINPDSVGLMGFSAGGHLVSTAVTHFDSSAIDHTRSPYLRPAFAILVNPVITFSDTFAHTGTREKLLGPLPETQQIDFFSAEKNVSLRTPPCLLIHAWEDTVVRVENSLNFFTALRKNNVPAALHIYQRGEHGLLSAPAFTEWFGRCLYWLNHELK